MMTPSRVGRTYQYGRRMCLGGVYHKAFPKLAHCEKDKPHCPTWIPACAGMTV